MTNKPLPTNRRLGPRRVTDVKVFASDGIEIKKCRLRDISLDGAFIETNKFALAKGSIVDLVLRIRRDGDTSACRVPAKVVRTERGGAALMFASLEEDGYKILRKYGVEYADRTVSMSEAARRAVEKVSD